MNKPHRDTIFVEDATLLEHTAYAGDQHIMTVHAPQIAAAAKPGSFAHITVHTLRPMRRPISIMRVNKQKGEVEFLYKAFGEGTALLAQHKPGEVISIMGPIGNPFVVHADKPRRVLIGGGVGIPPMIFLADSLRNETIKPLVIMGSEVPFPFKSQPSALMVPGMPEGVIAAMPLLEEWGIPSRLASKQGYPGCMDGYVTDVARAWLKTLDNTSLNEVELFACGPHPMLAAVAQLAREFDLACQVSLEEFMACAVGGCAGCTVKVETDKGTAMKRVCVDGPVFDAYQVFA